MKGSTLVETLIYMALLAILMIGVFSSVYVLMNARPKEDLTDQLIKTYYE